MPLEPGTRNAGRVPRKKTAATKPAQTALAQRLLDYGLSFLGTPYQWGGSDPQTGFDCSGLIQYVYGNFGVDLPRISSQQARAGTPVAAKDARPGDLVYFDTGPRNAGADHIGIYLGNGMMLAAPHTGAQVQIQPVGNATGFDRVLPDNAYKGMRRGQGGIPRYTPPAGVKIGRSTMDTTLADGGGGGHALSEKELAANYGFTSDFLNLHPKVHALIRKAVAENWGTGQVGTARFLAALKQTPYWKAQNIGNVRAQVGQTAASYAIPLSAQALDKWASDIVSGVTTQASFANHMRDRATSMFPYLKEEIANGQTVSQWADPYAQTAANLLGINPSTVDFTLPRWQAALHHVDENGKVKPMSLSDWQVRLKTDPRFDYDHSPDGIANAVNFATALGQAFGTVG